MNAMKNNIDETFKDRKKISICVPTYGNIPAQFLYNFVGLLNYNMKRFLIGTAIKTGQPTDKCRNECVKTALANGNDYIFFVDSDNLVPYTAIELLLEDMEKHNADLVTGIYFQKSKPYFPTIKDYKYKQFWTIVNPPIGKGNVISIGGTGMGCCLIKTEVFKKLKYPWFKFNYEKIGHKEIQISEDLYFCRSMNEAGMKLICDTNVVSTHIGAPVDHEEHLTYYELRKQQDDEHKEIIADLVEFTKQEEEVVLNKFAVGTSLLAKEWKEKDPKTDEEIKRFYKETENYLYDLAIWHNQDNWSNDEKFVAGIVANKGSRILDIGCGTGMLSLKLAKAGFNMTLADLDSKSLEFAEFRFKKHNQHYKVWKTDVEEFPPEGKYDVIMIMEVLEHLPIEVAKKMVDKIEVLKHEKTKIYYTVSFGKSDNQPMHFDITSEYKKLVERLTK